MLLGFSLTSIAQDAPKPPKSQERKGAPKELLEKYDTNKDGKLDKEERSKISPEDRKKMGPPRKKQPRTGGPDPIPEHLKKN